MSSDVVIAAIMSFFFGCLKVKVSKHMVVTNDQCAQTSVYICLELLCLESLKTIECFIMRMHQPNLKYWPLHVKMEPSDD